MDDRDNKTGNQISIRTTLTELTIAEVLTRWPKTAVTFHQHNMACVGCAVASFYTTTEAASVYGLSPEQFLDELIAVINQPAASN